MVSVEDAELVLVLKIVVFDRSIIGTRLISLQKTSSEIAVRTR